jgi:hypothetical protein
VITDLVTRLFAASALPLPNDPASHVRDWFADNQLAAIVMSASQAVSVLFLAAFVLLLRVPRARPFGLFAVGLMLVSSACAWTLAAVAPEASLDTVDLLRTSNFVTGGTAHVLTLGLFAFVASRTRGFGRPVRILATVALVVCVLSLSSLLVFEGAAFILLGRLLCMVWAICAAVSVILRRHRTSR